MKLLSLRLNDHGRHTDSQHEEPEVVPAREVDKMLTDKAEGARLDMNAEPVLSEIGIYRSALTGVDMQLRNIPVAVKKLMQTRKKKCVREQ